MAATATAAQLTEAHRLAQLRIGVDTVHRLRAAWPLLNPDDLDGSFEAWLRVASALIGRNRDVSGQVAAAYLAAFRIFELGPAPYTPLIAGPANPEALATSMLVTGPISIRKNLGNGLTVAQALDIAEAGSAAAGMRYALNGGRDTITGSVAADPKALGWSRAASGHACSFCAMLAGRGPVYSEGSVDFAAHDHCSCTAEPVYRTDGAWPAGSREYRDLWEQSTDGLGGADARNAFRQALTAGAAA